MSDNHWVCIQTHCLISLIKMDVSKCLLSNGLRLKRKQINCFITVHLVDLLLFWCWMALDPFKSTQDRFWDWWRCWNMISAQIWNKNIFRIFFWYKIKLIIITLVVGNHFHRQHMKHWLGFRLVRRMRKHLEQRFLFQFRCPSIVLVRWLWFGLRFHIPIGMILGQHRRHSSMFQRWHLDLAIELELKLVEQQKQQRPKRKVLPTNFSKQITAINIVSSCTT